MNLNLSVKSYRAFRDQAEMSVKPLTMLYGFNQAGKSTLLRLLALLADSLFGTSGPLDLESPAIKGSSFKELGWMGREMSMTPEFVIKTGDDPNAPRLAIQYADDKGLIVNRLALYRGEGGDKFRVSLDGEISRVGKTISGLYGGHYRGAAWNGRLNFENLIPAGLPDQALGIADAIRSTLSPLQRLQWLRANRVGEAAQVERPSRCCMPDGTDLAAAIRGDFEKSILEQASRWLSGQQGLCRDIAIVANASQHPTFWLGSDGRERLPLHLAGEGLRALIPILVLACWAESAAADKPSMLVIEEAEAHLHPTVQVQLFNRLVETVKSGVPVVVETHSVHMLRAMQLSILDGRLAPEDVGLHWVLQGKDGVAGVERIIVEPDASLTGWRPFVFETEQELAHQIIDMRWQQKQI